MSKTNESRKVQRLARAYNLPDCLMQKSGAKLIPLYAKIEELSLDKGFCYAGDRALAKLIGYDKTTAIRQRLELERLGLVIREGDGDNRKLFPWWQWATKMAEKGNLKAVDELLHRVVQRSYQSAFDFIPDNEPSPNLIAPDSEAIAGYINSYYPAKSFFELPEDDQKVARDQWRLTHIGDLCWLFEQECTPKAYQHFCKLNLKQKGKLESHAPHYAWGNRDNANMMMDLTKYLNPYNPGYMQRLRDRAGQKKQKSGKSGLTQEQANFNRGLMSQTNGSNDFFN